MINNSIDFDQTKSQLFQTSKSDCSYFFGEPTSNNDLADEFEQREKEINGFPNEIDEIKINQMPEDMSDIPSENFVKATSEYDKTYKLEMPVPPGAPEAKEINEKLYKLLPLAVELCKKEKEESEKKGIKKIKLNSMQDFHKACNENAMKNKNNFNSKEFFNTYDLLSIFEKLNNYKNNHEEINNNYKEDEKENSISFDNSNTEDSQEHGKNFNEGHLFI